MPILRGVGGNPIPPKMDTDKMDHPAFQSKTQETFLREKDYRTKCWSLFYELWETLFPKDEQENKPIKIHL